MRTRHRLLLTAATLAVTGTVAVAMNGGELVPDPVPTAVPLLEIRRDNVGVKVGQCGGTMLSPTWMLTARHCVDPLAERFGSGGKLIVDPEAPPLTPASPLYAWREGTAAAVAWDSGSHDGGRFVVAGNVKDPSDPRLLRPALWALQGNGYPDPLIGGGDGQVVVSLPGAGSAELVAVAVVSSGTYVAAGHVEIGGEVHALVLRFARTGVLLTTHIGPLGRAVAVAVDHDSGDAIVVGSRTDGGPVRWLAMRFAPEGTLRPAYGYVNAPSFGGELLDVAVVNGFVVVLGTQPSPDAPRVVAVLDDDAVETPVQPVPAWTAGDRPVALAADGRLGRVVVAGQNATNDRVVVSRHHVPTLFADAGFGSGGVTGRDIEIPDAVVNAIDAGVAVGWGPVVAIRIGSPSWNPSMSVVRFTDSGQPDAGFGQGGLVWWQEPALLYPAGMVMAHDDAVIVGRSLLPTAPVAVGFDMRSQHVPAGSRAVLGGSHADVELVVRHTDASLDAALVQLRTELVPASGVRLGGMVDADTLVLGQPLTCFGYGGDGEHLRQGELAFDHADDRHITLATGYPIEDPRWAELEPGDSGAGCFDGPRQVGINSSLSAEAPSEFFPRSKRQNLVRADILAGWIEAETGIDVTP